MDWLINFINSLNLSNFTFRDLLDVFLVAIGIYYLLIIIQGTRAMRIALGIIFLVLLSNFSYAFRLTTVQWLLSNFISVLVIAIIILFQSEIRRVLAQFGKNPFRKVRFNTDENLRTIDEICLAATLLASKKIGGIIVLEREQGLRNFIEVGRPIDATVNYDLLMAIFQPTSPLHDGAVIVQENRIAAASCFLPLTTNPSLSTKMGTRHRAAIGLTEETDAVAVIISEERGDVRISQDGKITKPLDKKTILELLTRLIIEEKKLTKHEASVRTKEFVAYDFSSVEEHSGEIK